MRKSKGLVLLGVSLLVAAGLYARPSGAKESRPSLTALDYAQIQQLYSHYSHYLDSGNAVKYADLFTPDAVFTTNLPAFGTIRGQKELAALAVRVGSPPPFVKPVHMANTVMIDPSPEGATGSAYLLAASAGEAGTQPHFTTYVYSDTFVKTAEGWRFKTRVLHQATPAKP